MECNNINVKLTNTINKVQKFRSLEIYEYDFVVF